MMKTNLLILFQLVICASIVAQTRLSGRITDPAGHALSLANIFLEGTYDGATTGADGNFEFTTAEQGRKILRVRFTGYKEFQIEVVLASYPQTFEIQLKEEIHSLDMVTITAGAFTAGDQSGRTIFRTVDIATTAGATADIAGALNTLPGTQKVGESGRLFVRGGDGNETRTFIDGMAVIDAYAPSAPEAPSRGRFLPFMFKGTSFSTGGYSAEYGQALSSVLVLDSKDKAEITRTDFGILSVGADVGHTQVWNKGSFGGKIQHTNLRPYFSLIEQRIDWASPPVSIEGQAAFRQQSGEYGLLKVYGNFSRSAFSLFDPPSDNVMVKQRYDLRNHYQYVNASYKNSFNANWMIRGGFSYTHQKNEIKTAKEIIEQERGIHAKTVLEGSLSERAEIKTGIEIMARSYKQGIDFNRRFAFNEFIISTFTESDIYANSYLVLRGGIRAEYNGLNNRLGIDPRVSLGYKTGSTGQLSLAYGTFRQSPANEWLRTNDQLASEKADHSIVNFQRIDNNRTFRVEAYYKRYKGLIKFANSTKARPDNNGDGFARGIEMFWRDKQSLRNIDYWIAYSFLDTRRTYLDFPVEATPSFASAHNVSVVYKHFISKLKSQLGFTYAYASGRPYFNPNNNAFHADRTPSYQDLSFNWSYLPKPALIIYFSCTNLFARDNIFGYKYSSELNALGLYEGTGIRQPAKQFLFAGIFVTLSKEKSVNQLPNL